MLPLLIVSASCGCDVFVIAPLDFVAIQVSNPNLKTGVTCFVMQM